VPARSWLQPFVPMRRLWVAELLISDRTAAKIRELHHIEPQEVLDAVVCVEKLRFIWHTHPVRGLRAIVQTVIRGVGVEVVLYPVPNHPMGDVYHLGSAYPR
jgi:hypothetical protein